MKRFLFILVFGLCFTGTSLAETIRVSVAISLKDAAEAIVQKYQLDGSDRVELTFGSSGQLEAQIENGAGVDLFISAGDAQIDQLAAAGLVEAGSRRVVVRNSLVLIVPADAKNPPAGLESLVAMPGRLSIGEPTTVPAGQYAMQVLNKLGLFEKLKDRIIFGANVRQVLSYVERAEVSAGIVYSTDAKMSGNRVRVIETIKPDLHEPIVYPAVILAHSSHRAAARHFLNYLSSDVARSIFTEKGFSLPLSGATSEPAR